MGAIALVGANLCSVRFIGADLQAEVANMKRVDS
jgi:hypothetical protein